MFVFSILIPNKRGVGSAAFVVRPHIELHVATKRTHFPPNIHMLESAPGSSPSRCLLRDTVVPIPEPEELIVNYIEPSHVVVQRCTGKTERMHAWDGWGGNGVSVRLSRSPLLQVFVLAFLPSLLLLLLLLPTMGVVRERRKTFPRPP